MALLFSGLIKCKNCGGNYKGRMDKKRRVYVCSRHENYKNCKRIPIDENFLRELIERRFQREMKDQEIKQVVDFIEIEEKLKFLIHFKNDIPIIFSENFIQY